MLMLKGNRISMNMAGIANSHMEVKQTLEVKVDSRINKFNSNAEFYVINRKFWQLEEISDKLKLPQEQRDCEHLYWKVEDLRKIPHFCDRLMKQLTLFDSTISFHINVYQTGKHRRRSH